MFYTVCILLGLEIKMQLIIHWKNLSHCSQMNFKLGNLNKIKFLVKFC